nr:2-isopropylmalate synthase A-like [Tanacetum cinerariifolium]
MLKNRKINEITSPEDIGLFRSNESGLTLGKLSIRILLYNGRHALNWKLFELGYDIDGMKLNDIFWRPKISVDSVGWSDELKGGDDARLSGLSKLDDFVLNVILFQKEATIADVVFKVIADMVRHKLMHSRIRNSMEVVKDAKIASIKACSNYLLLVFFYFIISSIVALKEEVMVFKRFASLGLENVFMYVQLLVRARKHRSLNDVVETQISSLL